MSDEFSSEFEAFLNQALKISLEEKSACYTEEDWKVLAAKAGISQEEWESLLMRLQDFLSRGRNFLKFENYEGAVLELEEAVTLAPYRADIIADCGRAHLGVYQQSGKREDSEKAEARLLRALDLQADHEGAAEDLAKLRSRASGSSGKQERPFFIGAIAAGLVAVVFLVLPRVEEKASVVVQPTTRTEMPAIDIEGEDPRFGAVVVGGRAFKVFREDISWHDAKKRCENMGGRLAVVPDFETLEVIRDLKKRQRLWLGATDEHEEGDWRWIDGTVVTIDAWSENQPFNLMGQEHYMEMGPAGGFNDVGVRGPTEKHRINGFVCEWDLTSNAKQSVSLRSSETSN